MSILVNRQTRLLVQGITGREGAFHTSQMVKYGTCIVGGVSPGKGGEMVCDVPVFNTVLEAKAATNANASVIFVPAPFAPDAMLEACDAKIALVICITEGIPALDVMRTYHHLKMCKTRLIGPNCPGIITPDEARIGIMPGHVHSKGKVGIMSRSGTLISEVAMDLTRRGIGQSTCVGIGGDPIVGTSFVELLDLFQQDPETQALVLIGEIGGTAEEEAAEFIRACVTKPVVAYITGQTAPEGKRMGHAGAIISGGHGTAAQKVRALKAAGIQVAESPAEVGELIDRSIKPS